MKKGFTLIELLAVIVIIGVVTLIAVPSITKNISSSKERLYKTQVQNIELAAKKWATDSYESLDKEFLNSSYVSIAMLQELGYLSKEKIYNPKNKEVMLGCIEVAYNMNDKTYGYTYDGYNVDCSIKADKGYYYKKDNSGGWVIDSTNQKESIYSFLVGSDGSNIVVTGSGLYDMEDRYVFRGNVNNNYVKIGGALFRILSLDKTTKTMKLISSSANGSSQWGTTTNNSFNASTLYTTKLNESLYPSITNTNVKWNIGTIESTDELNLNAVKAYEGKTKIVSEIGLISMSEYIEASINMECSNGDFSKCKEDNYLSIPDSWTTTTTEDSVVYIDSSKGISLESDLINAHHNIYRVINVITMEKSGSGTELDPFIISIQES